MICQNCKEFDFIKELEHYFVTSNFSKPLNYFDEYAVENQGTKFPCENCGKMVLVGDLYLFDEDDIETIKEELFCEFAKEVVKHIESCEECGHGQFMQGLRHSIERTFNDEDDDPEGMFDRYNSTTMISDLIYDVIGFDEDYYEDIVKYIRCRCGNGSGVDNRDHIGYGKFSLFDEVYTSENIKYFEETFYGKSYIKIKEEIKRIAQVCSYSDLVDLRNEFMNNPYFISQNNIFNGIYSFLKSLYNQDNCIVLYPSKRVYRARVNEGNILYPADEMWGPPLEKTRQNRYNTTGFPVLYCSNNKDVLYLEVPNSGSHGYTFATLRLLRPFKMLKINPTFGYEFQGFIEEPVPIDCENNDFKVQYIITNIVSSIAKNVGFDGIAYLSVKDKRHINYAIFDYKKNIDIEIINITCN